MKKTIKSKYQLLLLVLFGVLILESALILLACQLNTDLKQMINSIQSIIILFLLLQFVLFVSIYYYIPYQYERALKEIYQLIHEISDGKYQIDLELKTKDQSVEISSLISALQKMMSIIIRFDELKADKIYEHHQRIMSLIKLIPQGCVIVSIIGEIVYMNDEIKHSFPALSENLNIVENLLPESIEEGLKPLIINCMRQGTSLHDELFFDKATGNSFNLSSAIVRNRKGQITGSVFLLNKTVNE